MALRCKPGDMAMIVDNLPELNGKVVTIEQLVTLATHMCPACRSSARYWNHTRVAVGNSECYATCDCFLRPIRPQADDAQDESAAWLPPVPSTEKEPA